jgi:Uri superfamily endonuclease
LYWNIDHLLDDETVHLTHVIALRSPDRLEARLGQLMMQDEATLIVEPGLGANDIPGNTHLLQVIAPEAWWASLPNRLADHFKTSLEV